MKLWRIATLLAVTILAASAPLGSAPTVEITWSSTQLNPVNEQEWARNTLLRPFEEESGMRVRFVSDLAGPFIDRLVAEARAGRGTVDIIGTLHGDYPLLVAEGAVQRNT